jgi:hypothetical protein
MPCYDKEFQNAAPAPGKNFDAAPSPAPLQYIMAKFLKQTKELIHLVHLILYDLFC